MIQPIRRIPLAIFFATSVLILASGFSVYAQQIAVPPAPLNEIVETEMPSAQTNSVAPGYWIVGTQSSPQNFDDSAPVFCATVTRYDHGCGYRRSDIQELTQSLQPGSPVSIVCHGSFVNWNDVLTESCETWKWLHHACPQKPLQMIYFSWPSDRPVFSPIVQLDVNRLGRRAGRNGFYMASLIQQIPSECPISMIGHSHGTRVITSALHLMAGGTVDGYHLAPGPYPYHRMRAVFAASAMDHNWMNSGYRYDRALCTVECVLNLRNTCDPALFIYPLRRPFSCGALGYRGVTEKDMKELGPHGHKIQDWDLTGNIGVGHYWPNYFMRPWLAQAIRSYLFFDE